VQHRTFIGTLEDVSDLKVSVEMSCSVEKTDKRLRFQAWLPAFPEPLARVRAWVKVARFRGRFLIRHQAA
jgi:hypothetical protein